MRAAQQADREAERRFPIRVRIAVPPEGFGSRLDQIIAWLDANCGADGWTSTPSSTRGVVNDALAVYFLDATIASAFVARWCVAQRLESTCGVCGSIEITQLDCAIHARCNETVTVQFATVQVRTTQEACADLPEPLLPWPYLCPELVIDGRPIPRGWEYAVGHWIKGGLHHVEIPKSSRGVRSVAFLGEDEEMVIVTSEGKFEVRSSDGLTATLQADISWRKRLDGTRG